jgi:membrane protease subunit HflC
MRWKILLPLALPVLIAPLCVFTVDRTELVYLTQLGRPLATLDGADDADAGLHFKWPWPVQSVQRFDRRLRTFDLPSAELLTRDPKHKTIDRTLSLDAYVCWRIPDRDHVDLFVRSVGTTAGAETLLSQRVSSELGAEIGKMKLEDLISTDASKVDRLRERLRRQLLDGSSDGTPSLRQSALQEYGIEVVDVRLRRANYPSAVREAIFERIRSERGEKAADYQSEGERRAADIKSAGDRRVSELKAEAKAEALRLRGLADAEADHIRNEAHKKDPEFYAFLRKLEEYQRILGDNKSVLLLSTHRELFDVLFHPPAVGKSPEMPVDRPVPPSPPSGASPGTRPLLSPRGK